MSQSLPVFLPSTAVIVNNPYSSARIHSLNRGVPLDPLTHRPSDDSHTRGFYLDLPEDMNTRAPAVTFCNKKLTPLHTKHSTYRRAPLPNSHDPHRTNAPLRAVGTHMRPASASAGDRRASASPSIPKGRPLSASRVPYDVYRPELLSRTPGLPTHDVHFTQMQMKRIQEEMKWQKRDYLAARGKEAQWDEAVRGSRNDLAATEAELRGWRALSPEPLPRDRDDATCHVKGTPAELCARGNGCDGRTSIDPRSGTLRRTVVVNQGSDVWPPQRGSIAGLCYDTSRWTREDDDDDDNNYESCSRGPHAPRSDAAIERLTQRLSSLRSECEMLEEAVKMNSARPWIEPELLNEASPFVKSGPPPAGFHQRLDFLMREHESNFRALQELVARNRDNGSGF
eukprot:gnl/Spiro4/7573_TR3972_c0_g1_i1.p1 gnl/Spiro4/7573_TR3972_c0_g1~~gnl/Spiro4/7573_TR3972_c0_g1_i1.p1  ORF type:complete len:397 (+),score=83.46 gnl/Spiro4/7573_TR3972_c0_g1_i1:34-1224(+)